jgi:gliding motility-associated-like protein
LDSNVKCDERFEHSFLLCVDLRMKPFFLLLFAFTVTFFSFGQRQNNQWRFGVGGGIQFNNGAPEAVNGAVLTASEGSASIADRNTGALLFYTDGVTVWNANNQVMPNGTGLLGGTIALSSTAAAAIVPRPGNDFQYYLVCIDEQFGGSGLTYSLVDMQLDGGNGDVVVGQKNIPLFASNSEKLQVVPNATNTGYWIVTHNGDNTFVAFAVSNTGISTTPVLSTIGLSHGNGSGHMKISRQLNTLAMGNLFESVIELFNFNTTTGVVSNQLVIPFDFMAQFYGVEFSENGQVLYVSNLDFIIQYDLTQVTPAAIAASAFVVFDGIFEFPATLQIGPDHRIYCNTGSIAAIECPNNLGAACNFNQDNVVPNLGGGGGYGLPLWTYVLSEEPTLFPEISYEGECDGEEVVFSFDNPPVLFDEIRWDFGDGSPELIANNADPVIHTYSAPDSYTVRAIIVKACSELVVETQVTIIECTDPFITGIAASGDSCALGPFTFSSIGQGFSPFYTFTFNDAENAVEELTLTNLNAPVTAAYTFSAPGTYEVCLTFLRPDGLEESYCTLVSAGACCTFEVEQSGSCLNEAFSFDIATATAVDSVEWIFSDGSASFVENDASTAYSFETEGVADHLAVVYSLCGVDSLSFSTVAVNCVDEVCLPFVPNAFTPNNDNLNEVFRAVVECELEYFSFSIFNRWGAQIFESDVPGDGWNGGLNGYYAPDGVYYYLIEYAQPGEQRVGLSGHFTLFR